jgi:ubiquitin carboxyl-terminal hydrolase 10
VVDDFGLPSATVTGEEATNTEDPDIKPTSQPVKNAPKLWTGLFKGPTGTTTTATGNGIQANPSALVSTSTFSKTNSESLADALRAFNASAADAKLAFIKPRGLVNTGNMCYMNSVS